MMVKADQRQPPSDESPHPLPENAGALAAPTEGTVPKPTDPEAKERERGSIHRHAVVTEVSVTMLRSHCPTLGTGSCRRRLSPSLTSPSLACNRFRIVCRITMNRPLLRFFPQMCVKPKEIEGLRFPLTAAASVLGRKGPELRQPRLLGVRLQVELAESLLKRRPKPLGILPMLEAHHDVVGPAHHNDSTIGLSMPPVVSSEIEGVVQVAARQERRCTRPGPSRFPCMMFPDVLRVFDRAGLPCISPLRRTGCGFPLPATASAPRSDGLSRLNTRPVRTPIDASVPPLRAVPHDSGPVWVATPSPYDSFIHYTMPV